VSSVIPWLSDAGLEGLAKFTKHRLTEETLQWVFITIQACGYELTSVTETAYSLDAKLPHLTNSYVFSPAPAMCSKALRRLHAEIQCQAEEFSLERDTRTCENERLRSELSEAQVQATQTLTESQLRIDSMAEEHMQMAAIHAQEVAELRTEVAESRLELREEIADSRTRGSKQFEEFAEFKESLLADFRARQAELQDTLAITEAQSRSRAEELHEMKSENMALQEIANRASAPPAEPVVEVFDVGMSGDGMARHIRIECPGVDGESIDLESLPNGVLVKMQRTCRQGCRVGEWTAFEREFNYDHRTEGRFDLRMDECVLENGVLQLVLKKTPPQRMKLRSLLSPLAPVAEACDTPPQSAAASDVEASVPLYDMCSLTLQSSQWVHVAEQSAPQLQETDSVKTLAMSAPAAIPLHQCLMIGSRLLSQDGSLVQARELHPGDKLRSVRSENGQFIFSEVAVKAMRELPMRERDTVLVMLALRDTDNHVTLEVTADHAVVARRHQEVDWKATAAAELIAADSLVLSVANVGGELQNCAFQVTQVQRVTKSCQVIEVELDNMHEALCHALGDDAQTLEGVFGVVLGCPPRPALISEWKSGFLNVREAKGAADGASVDSKCFSDPTHDATNNGSHMYAVIRPPHDAACKAFCKYHAKGKCKAGQLCRLCHHPDHYSSKGSFTRRAKRR